MTFFKLPTLNSISKRKKFHWLFILLCALIVIISAILIALNSSYLDWDFNEPETAVAGTILHAFEWFFVRFAPIILIGGIIGIVLTRKKIKI